MHLVSCLLGASHFPASFPTCPPAPALTVSQSDELLLLSPEMRLMLLDHVFLRFDDLVKKAGALKIETIGGVYLVAANGAGRGSRMDPAVPHSPDPCRHLCLY